MKKYRYYFRFDKEELWLNEMVEKGWRFTGRSFWGTYLFEKAEPQLQNIRIDYRQFNRSSDLSDYIQLFKDSGWQHIYGTKYSGNQYFIPIGKDAPEDIFSDNASKAGRYRRFGEVWLTILAIYTALFTVNISNGSIDPSVILNPKVLYLTPGLWDLTGLEFLRAFLFETPFALMRGLFWLFELVMIGISLYYSIRAHYEGKKTIKKVL